MTTNETSERVERTVALTVVGKEKFIADIQEITQTMRELNEELVKAGLRIERTGG